MKKLEQVEKHADRVLGRRKKHLFLIMITDTGNAWEMKAEYWDGQPGSFDPDDTQTTYYTTLGEAEAAADALQGGSLRKVPVIVGGDLEA